MTTSTVHANACVVALAVESAGAVAGPTAYWRAATWAFGLGGNFTHEDFITAAQSWGLDAAGLRHPRRAAGALQASGVHGHATGVVAPVFETLQALHEDGDDVAGGDRADDAAHGGFSSRVGDGANSRDLAME